MGTLILLKAFSPNRELVRCIAPRLGPLKSVTIDCLQLDDYSIVSILGPHLQELNLLKCPSLSYHVLPSIGRKCPNLRYHFVCTNHYYIKMLEK